MHYLRQKLAAFSDLWLSAKPDTAAGGKRTTALTLVAALVWLSALGVAMVLINNHSSTSGLIGEAPAHWPAESRIPVDAKLPTLLMFIHPHCPCTRASLGEVERLMADCPRQCNVHFVFLRPEGVSTNWINTDLWRKASAIRGATVICDDDGMEARRFHAGTSGETMLYDAEGKLVFQGGITSSRGHSGDNPGRSGLEALLRRKISDQIKTPVFGCSLFDEQCEKGDVACKLQ